MRTLSVKWVLFLRTGPVYFVIRNYFLAGLLLHLITLLTFCLAIYLGHIIFLRDYAHDHFKLFFLTWLFTWLISVSILSQFDAWSRFQDYKLMKDLIYRYGFRYKFIRAMRHSRCQRDAAFVAADSLGFGARLRKYFNRAGYRWYHILPDFLVTDPMYMISWHFWKTTFFSRYYSSKYFNY